MASLFDEFKVVAIIVGIIFGVGLIQQNVLILFPQLAGLLGVIVGTIIIFLFVAIDLKWVRKMF